MVDAPPSIPHVTPADSRAASDAPDAPGADSLLFAAITRYIRVQEVGALVLCAIVGLVAAAVTVRGGFAWWPWMSPLVMLGAGGVWGLADRARGAAPGRIALVALTLLRGTSTLVGAGSALFLAAMLFAGLFGRVIS